MKTLYITDLQKSLVFENETFVIFDQERAMDKNGKPYYNLTLGDKTGRVPAKIWSDRMDSVETKVLKTGSVVQISAKVEEFKGKLQLNILTLSGVDENALDEYLESSEFNPDEMFEEITKTIDGIKDGDIRKVLKKIFENEEISRKFKYWPAAVSVHHDFRSGLIQHVLEMLEISKSLKKFYPEADYDILTAGILLHDIGKLMELDASGIVASYSKEGSLMGHITLGSLLFAENAKGELQEDKYLHILHLILSHHGSLEYGSPVLPSTVEAIMLTMIDNLSSKARVADKARRRITADSDFSSYIPWLENTRIWNGGKTNEKFEGDQMTF